MVIFMAVTAAMVGSGTVVMAGVAMAGAALLEAGSAVEAVAGTDAPMLKPGSWS